METCRVPTYLLSLLTWKTIKRRTLIEMPLPGEVIDVINRKVIRCKVEFLHYEIINEQPNFINNMINSEIHSVGTEGKAEP